MTIVGSVADRVRGLLLGAACAEALGAPFTGACGVPRAHRDQWCTSSQPLRYTAGTASTLALADHLSASPAPPPRLGEQDIGIALGAMWVREPWRGYGAAETSVLRMLHAGTRWQDAGRATYPNGSFGTGAAVRAGPVGVVDHDLDHIAALARASARPTHVHELGQDGAAAHAVAVALAATSADRPIDATAFIGQIARRATTSLFEEAFDRARGVIGRGDAGTVAQRVGTAPTAWEAVPAALVAFLRHPTSYVDGVRFALSMGGATGSIAAMAGALGGARGGVGAIPLVWLARLENAALICAAADDLARTIDGAAPLPRTPPDRHTTVPPFLC